MPENLNFLDKIFWSSSLIFVPKPSIGDAFIKYFDFIEFTLNMCSKKIKGNGFIRFILRISSQSSGTTRNPFQINLLSVKRRKPFFSDKSYKSVSLLFPFCLRYYSIICPVFFHYLFTICPVYVQSITGQRLDND